MRRYRTRTDKVKFLHEQHLAILASPDFVCDQWRLDFQCFYDDVIDMTPTKVAGRFLAWKNETLGFSPGNVEWHFYRTIGRARLSSTKAAKKPRRTSEATRKALAQSKEALREEADRLKDERRKMLAEQYRQWERLKRSFPD